MIISIRAGNLRHGDELPAETVADLEAGIHQSRTAPVDVNGAVMVDRVMHGAFDGDLMILDLVDGRTLEVDPTITINIVR